MNAVGKAYNALTGAELKTIILAEVARALDNAGINSHAITYPMATWHWDLSISQRDAGGQPAAETPERKVEAGSPPAALEAAKADANQRLMTALRDGSKRFKHTPPAPTEVREAEKLPVPEA